MKFNSLVIATITVLLSVTTFAKKKVKTPDSLAGAKIVTKADVKKLLSEGAKIVDVRKKLEFKEAHVDGAMHVAYKEKSKKVADFDMSKDKFKTEKLPQDKSASIIFYCNGATCWKSYKASKTAVAKGWKKVFWFRGGYPEWSK